ncbi:MAG: hypothetical protein HQ522_09245 [Bacteroidetes bacterium]|nr:hypothetical protein [Bacteroidota bacterium]
MKQYTHAWLALMAIKRLEKANVPVNYSKSCQSLVSWFKNYRDDVVQGAWYPDSVIKDMASSHVLKFAPENGGDSRFRKLPATYHYAQRWKNLNKIKHAFKIEKGNLPDRCEALAHSIIDNLKMQESEQKGSPIVPTDNHVATLFFMLSHYVADAHMPFHCDARPFSEGKNLHAKIEKEWDDRIRACYEIDFDNERFFYSKDGYPLRTNVNDNVIDLIEAETKTRKFTAGWGSGNNNTWDFMSAICQHSYLTSYKMVPADKDNTLEWGDFLALNVNPSFEVYSNELLMDAIDSIVRVWLRVWRHYLTWLK